MNAISGRHVNIVFTESGKMILQGYRFYRRFSYQIKHNNESSEDNPTVIYPPEGYKKAIDGWPCMKADNVYVLFEKENGEQDVFHNRNDETWVKTELPEGHKVKKVVSCRYTQTWIVCDQGKAWCLTTD